MDGGGPLVARRPFSDAQRPSLLCGEITMPVQTPKAPRAEITNGANPPASDADRKALLDGLNQDLAGEYQALMMYVHYSAKVTGPYRRELRAMFQAEIADELGHAQFLADKIVALGG